jgi:hypothetical protein
MALETFLSEGYDAFVLMGWRKGGFGPRRSRTALRIFLIILAIEAGLLLAFDVVRFTFFRDGIADLLRQNWHVVRPDWGAVPAYVFWAVVFAVCYRRDRAERRRIANAEG